MLSLLAQVLGRTPLSRAGGVLMVLGLGLLSYSALAYAGLALIFYAAPQLDLGRAVMGLTGAFALTGLAITRYVFVRAVDEEVFKRRVLVWGAGARARAIGKRLRRRTDQRGTGARRISPGYHTGLAWIRAASLLFGRSRTSSATRRW